jgi:CRP-like cAMP-binding protein
MSTFTEEERRGLAALAPMQGLPERALEGLIAQSERLAVPSGRVLFRRGDHEDFLLFLLSGSVDLADAQYQVRCVVAGTEAASFALDEASPFRVAAVATAPSVLAKVPRDALDVTLTWGQAGDYVVSELSDCVAGSGDWMAGLLASPIFSMVAPAQLQALFSAFEPVLYAAGDVVLREGEEGDYFYVVQSGICEITRAGSSEVLAAPGPGECFGEDALISGARRNATITLRTDGVLRRLEKAAFRDLVEEPVLSRVLASDLAYLRQAGQELVLVDVRSEAEHAHDSFPGSINLPLRTLRERIGELPQGGTILTVCDGGRRSRLAAFVLLGAGYDVRVLERNEDRPPERTLRKQVST